MSIEFRADTEATRRGYAGRRVMCLVCGDILQSQHRHDMRGCSCDSESRVYVDGGAEYMKISFADDSDFIVLDQERSDNTEVPGLTGHERSDAS